MNTTDRAILTKHVEAAAAVLDRVLELLHERDPEGHAALVKQLAARSVVPSVSVALAPDGGAFLTCQVMTPDDEVHELLAVDLTAHHVAQH
jgi:hypothetical protein